MAIKGYFAFTPKLQHYWKLTIRLFGVISKTLVRQSYPFAEIQLVFTKLFVSMWHKAEWMGRPMKLELTRIGLLVQLANHYTTRGAQRYSWYILLSQLTGQFLYVYIYIYIYIYTRVTWKVHRLTKILSWNVTEWGLFFNIVHLLSSHFISVAVLEMHE